MNLSMRNNPHHALGTFIICLSSIVFSAAAFALDKVPTKDSPRTSDIENIKRFTDSVLVFRDTVAYDEVAFPAGKVTYRDEKLSAAKSVARSGERTMLTYIAPQGRSTLEVLRNYQQDLKASGFKPLYECAEEACGEVSAFTDANNFNFANTLFKDSVYSTSRGAAHVCAAGVQITGFRYALMENAGIGETLAVMTWKPLVKGYALPCPDALENHPSVMVFHIKAKAMEAKMMLLSASEMTQAISASGKVALYGILFDTSRADVKPASQASLLEIAKLMKTDTKLRLLVVGHTDSVGEFESNRDLSQRRANAVVNALTAQHAVDGKRLQSFGASFAAPVASNSAETGREKNRRVELVAY